MAAIWTRVARPSTTSFLTSLRVSRCLSIAGHAGHASGRAAARRWASAAVASSKESAEKENTERVDASSSEIHSDQPEFTSLKDRISNETLKAITVSPFKLKHMSPVQAAVLPLLPQLAEPYDPSADDSKRPPRDLLVRAKTGTGKTLAFLVPAIEARLKAIEAYGKKAVKDAGLEDDTNLEMRARRLFVRKEPGVLIVSPTRELATQIADEALRLTKHHDDFQVQVLVGGRSKTEQMRSWMRGRRDIVVGTPGRLIDLLQSEPEVKKSIEQCKLLILDEADTLLDMGFRDDVETIIQSLLPTPERQTFMFSATVSTQIKQIARAALDKNHEFINCVSDNASPVHAQIPQYHTVLPGAGEQIPHLLRLLAHDQLSNPGKAKAIVFFPTTKMTRMFANLMRQLTSTCLPAGQRTNIYEMHSQRQQRVRETTSARFRSDRSGASILITSDVSARGIDYPGVTRVIQVGIPSGPDQYVHRVGRTGRGAAMNGRADLVLLPWELGFVTQNLSHIQLKPLTTDELKNQVTELAKTFDQDPQAFFGDTLQDRNVRAYRAPYTPVLEDIPNSVNALLKIFDEESVTDTMSSLLGFYVTKFSELGTSQQEILKGLQDWTVEACGLPKPPYVSPAFLQKIGMKDRSPKSSFSRNTGDRDRAPRKDSSSRWSERGSYKARDSGDDSRRSFRSNDRSYGSERSFRRSDDGSRSSSYGSRDRSSYGGERSFGSRDRSFGDRPKRTFERRQERSSYGESDD